jgi:hypothetical protein
MVPRGTTKFPHGLIKAYSASQIHTRDVLEMLSNKAPVMRQRRIGSDMTTLIRYTFQAPDIDAEGGGGTGKYEKFLHFEDFTPRFTGIPLTWDGITGHYAGANSCLVICPGLFAMNTKIAGNATHATTTGTTGFFDRIRLVALKVKYSPSNSISGGRIAMALLPMKDVTAGAVSVPHALTMQVGDYQDFVGDLAAGLPPGPFPLTPQGWDAIASRDTSDGHFQYATGRVADKHVIYWCPISDSRYTDFADARDTGPLNFFGAGNDLCLLTRGASCPAGALLGSFHITAIVEVSGVTLL